MSVKKFAKTFIPLCQVNKDMQMPHDQQYLTFHRSCRIKKMSISIQRQEHYWKTYDNFAVFSCIRIRIN